MQVPLFSQLIWDASGLIPMIVQDHDTKDVLMVGWVNREALAKTIETGSATFWSRSRKKLWTKGETSGNVMRVKELRFDCDLDTIVALVEPAGPACHLGYRSCFFRKLEPMRADGALRVFCEREVDPDQLYGKKG
jgi:phosphoribosyl-AMP cyclohydrolase